MSSPVLAIAPLVEPPDATVHLPGSKSHTNRALLCAAVAKGQSTLVGALEAEDTAAMEGALRQLGIAITRRPDGVLEVLGSAGALAPGPLLLNVDQSGTTGRFVLPLLATGRGTYQLDGDSQLRLRPFGALVEALRTLGATIEGSELPLLIHGAACKGGEVALPGSTSSQFLSGLLMSAPLFGGRVTIQVEDKLVSRPYIDLTLATMAHFGITLSHHDYRRFEVEPQQYQGAVCQIEPDASAASYFFAAAAICGGRVRVAGLDASTVQGDLAFVEVLQQMGAEVVYGDGWTEVTGPERLKGVDIDMANISDTAQTLAVVATFADRPTTISGIGFIKYKESDRIGAVVSELSRLGIRAQQIDDGLKVWPGAPDAGVVKTYDDHRMAMSFSLLGLRHAGIRIGDPGCVRKTFPNFFQVLEDLRR